MERTNRTQGERKFYAAKRGVRFNPLKFYWFYGKGDLAETDEVLGVHTDRISRTASTIDQAKGELRSAIRALGGNAAVAVIIERGSATKCSWAYEPAPYTASACAGLIVNKKLNEKKKNELYSKFFLTGSQIEEVGGFSLPKLSFTNAIKGILSNLGFCK